MRIIAGSLKGRRLVAVPGRHVRPTSDSLRETLFNVLGSTVEGAVVLDAFAGTGAIGLEALSRGAARVTFVEQDPRALKAISTNIARCGAENACTIIRGDFLRTRAHGYDLIVLDPPYEMQALPMTLEHATGMAAPNGRIVLEHSRRRDVPASVSNWTRVRELTAGDSTLSFYLRSPRD